MVQIFEKYVEKTDIHDGLRCSHRDAKIIHLPTQYSNEGRAQLVVKDENDKTWMLTIETKNERIHFTKGWNEFSNEKGITVGDRISLYKDDDLVGSGTQYSIKVTKAKKRVG